MKLRLAVVCLLLCCLGPLRGIADADGPKDNHPDNVRAVPPIGIELDAETTQKLYDQLQPIEDGIERLKKSHQQPQTIDLLPDVEIFTRAVRGAIEHREFYSKNDVKHAAELLNIAANRLKQLAAGKTPWTKETGLVVRGFRSQLDGTVQPYGLVVPESFATATHTPHRCDIWLHGRGERSLENQFLWQRLHSAGQYTPAKTFVLHPYGRYSNAFKFAGEIDVLEALEHVQSQYPIDADRIGMRGFSMGGAGCWQLAVHYADRWFATNPGAGFSETPLFLKSFQKETLHPKPWEETLWRWYDCPGYAANLTQLPTIAYSGENDIQKQAADVMEAALNYEGIDLLHVIGPKTGHRIHPESKTIISAKWDSLAERGRNRFPNRLRFTTFTLRYNRMHWLTVDALEQHWEEARVNARIDGSQVFVEPRNVAAFTLEFPAGHAPFPTDKPVHVKIGEQNFRQRPKSDGSWKFSVVKTDGKWSTGEFEKTLRKQHALQGPIDDAFMDSFIFVRPTGTAAHAAVGKWVDRELNRAIGEWRRQFRGDVRIVDDVELTPEQIASNHLVLWGDPSSNAVIRKVIGKLPIEWDEDTLATDDFTGTPQTQVPVMIYPNPLNQNRYVVLNSGPTYREYAYLNNARQVPMLPDWAIVDVTDSKSEEWPLSRWPGQITQAGFFDENWRFRKSTD
ncbi:prolyl oligopeptidase family serine peptidase [Thalassoroseus pseudoceratinae]|uniref:prolyl oligopeptidase family serine peptidase n=1 Tax=Thalassoroseus pseudoceratinae TaxID=2713176 RepID=UPI001423AA71|nr:prolyl oligopeptidase family serine peptidase [Thalassoroseus pseudoceratinae]